MYGKQLVKFIDSIHIDRPVHRSSAIISTTGILDLRHFFEIKPGSKAAQVYH